MAQIFAQAHIKKIQEFTFRNIDKFQTGQLITRLTSDVNQVQFLVMMSLRILTRAPLLRIGSVIFLWVTSPDLAIIMLGLLPLTAVIMYLFIKTAGPLFKEVQQKIDELNQVLQENLSGIRVVKAFVRKELGLVLQDVILFSGTVMENIRYGRLDATEEECIQAAKLANAHQFIVRLPMGYQTVLTERGENLSLGQRQLLSIARAILADPSILKLDEVTSNVDTRTESQIQEALLNLMRNRTSFIIAHRLSTIRNADQILVIKDGKIFEKGDHESLIEKKGFYNNLYMSQFKGKNRKIEAVIQ